MNSTYEAMRHFADSWGLLYMFVIFVGVIAFVLRPGAKQHAMHASRIPLEDEHPADKDNR
jgi:cytochrome c oxidase cbb3-type subunit IV